MHEKDQSPEPLPTHEYDDHGTFTIPWTPAIRNGVQLTRLRRETCTC